VTLEVTETEPVLKGQTAAASYKPAILENNVRSSVPPFVGIGDKIIVATEDGSYVKRAEN
jgi:elongation factor P